VHRRDEDNVVRAFARNREIRNIERLGEYGAVHAPVVDFSKTVNVYVYGSQVGLVGVKASAGVIVMAGEDVGLPVREESGAENQKNWGYPRRPKFVKTIHGTNTTWLRPFGFFEN